MVPMTPSLMHISLTVPCSHALYQNLLIFRIIIISILEVPAAVAFNIRLILLIILARYATLDNSCTIIYVTNKIIDVL